MTQAAVVQFALEPLAVELRDIAVPEIGDNDVLLRVGAVSVCGSDVHQAYNTHSWPVNVPVVLGHEFAGTVARAGKAVTAFREGDRVVSETAAEVCGVCMLCRTGRYNLCPTRKGFGYGINGAMASYVKVPARDSRYAAIRARVPGGAALGGVQRHVCEFDHPSRRRCGRARTGTDWPAVRPNGGARRRRSADRRRTDG